MTTKNDGGSKKSRKLSDEKLQQKIDWHPHESQQEVIRVADNMREIVLCAGRRFGKSALCAYIALKYLLQPEKKIWIVAPTYDLTLKVFNYLVRWFLLVAPSQQNGVHTRPTPQIHTARGTTLECKSTENPKSLLGEELDLIIVDEAAQIDVRIWEQYLYPTLATRRGKIIFISTPLGKNWFYHQFQKIVDFGAAFQFPSNCNPAFPDEEWERAKNNLPEHVFRQEYQAQFMDDADSVFRNVRDIVRDGVESDAVPRHTYTVGVDLGKYRDFTVLTVMDMHTNTVVHIDRFKQIDWTMQKARIQALARRYNNARVVIDSTGKGDPIADELRQNGLIVDDITYSNQSKSKLIQKLASFIEQKWITIPPHDVLIGELQSFGYNVSNSGNVQYNAPSGLHDDCVNSLALAVWNLHGRSEAPTAIQQELKNVKKKVKTSFI